MADINLGVGGANSASDAYEIANSLKFEADNTEYLSHSSSSGSGTKVTYSFWCKRTELDSSSYMQVSGISTSSETVRFMFYQDSVRLDAGNSSTGKILVTNRKFRDTSAWYHFFVVIDTTLATEGDRHQLWVNGVRETSFSTEQYPTQDFSVATDQSNATWRYGAYDSTYYKFSGYLADCYRLDGIAATYTDFGKFDTNGIWIPKEYTGSFGSNGHYLDFEDSSSLGADDSGNSNNFTLNNIAAADQATDTPTNNFCTPLLIQPYNSTDSISHTEGGTKLTTASGTGWRTNMATMSLSSGKWYFEAKHPGTIDGDAIMTSIVPTARFGNSAYASFYGGQSSGDGLGWYWDSKRFRYDDGSAITPTVNTVNSGDILSIALDMDNGFAYSRINGGAWHNNGSANGDPTSGSSGTGGFAVADEPHMICTSMYHPSKNFFVNFGGYNAFPVSSAESDANGYGTFEYAPPSGYYAICTKNLSEYG